MITTEYVQAAYTKVLEQVSLLLPVDRWKQPPVGMEFTTKKTKYGLATSNGCIFINEAFLGTTAFTKLDFTLRHELAHLAVGLEQHHNRQFRRVESWFGVDPDRDLSEDIEQICGKIPYKYNILAHLENGEIKDLGGAHRKSKRYTEYPRNSRYNMSVDGIQIVHFKFQAN